MKIAITGKGGSGKTTIAACLARVYADRGYRVIAVDADPTLNLSILFGYEDIKPISEMKSLVNERSVVSGVLVRMNPKVNDLIDRYSIKISKNLRLLVSGTVRKAGSGCLCPENSLLRSLLQELVLKRNEIVILDMEAGLEIMSRGTIRNIDAILAITEPNYGSVNVTKKILKFASELGIKNSYVIANKIKDEKEYRYLSQEFDIFYRFPFIDEVQRSSMYGELSTKNSIFYRQMNELSGRLIDK